MKTVHPSTIETLAELEQEMVAAKRFTTAEALREALVALVRTSPGWLTTGQAADRLGVTIPTVKDWIRRGTLKGRQVGNRWWVSVESVERVLGIREMLAEMEEDGYPTEEEIHDLTKRIRRRMGGQKRAEVG